MQTRPDGVRHRMMAVAVEERRLLDSRPGLVLRASVRRFVDACARLVHFDHPVTAVVRSFRDVDSLLPAPGQFTTGSDFERRCFALVEELRPVLSGLAARLDAGISQDEQNGIREPVLRIPSLVLLGEVPPDFPFELVCWNEANAVAEGVQRPYLTAELIRLEGSHAPADRFGLVGPMTELAIRFEDVPDARPATAMEIEAVLADFCSRAPWPV
ncbi:hypothetical protein WEH80_05530 [Actinomycetes bacterium KLBMP 9759]